MKFTTTLFALVLSLSLAGQNPYIDSLKIVTETAEIPVRVRAKINLGLAYRGMGEYGLFEKEIREAIKLGAQSEDKKPLVHAYNVRGWTLSYPPKVHLDSTVYYVNKGKQLAESIGYDFGLAESYYELGYHYAYFKSEIEDSVKHFFTNAIGLFDEEVDREFGMLIDAYKNLAFYYNRIGKVEMALSFVDSAETYRIDPHIMNVRAIIYDNTGQYARAIDTYLQSLSLALANNDTSSINGSYNNIAAAYGNQGNEIKAKEYFMKSWNLTKLKLKSTGGFDVVQILRNLGMVYSALDMQDSARFFFKKAINEGEARKVIDPMYAPYFGMGEMHYKLGELDSAEWYLKKAISYSEKSNEFRVRSSAKNALGDVYYDRGKFSSSLEWYNVALEDAKSVDYVKTITDAYAGIYKVQNRLGNYKKALEAHVLYKTFADSIFNKSNTEKISELEAKFLYDQEKQDLVAEQEKETLVLETEVKRQHDLQVMYLAISAAFVLLFILAVYSYRRKNKDNKIIQEKSNQLEQSNIELKELSEFKQGMTNMIAHDIKNPLNSIIFLSKKIKDKSGREIGNASSSILRLITNMLDVEKFEDTKPSLKLESVSISELIQEASLSVELLLHDKSIKLINELEQDGKVDVDKDIILRVLINLLSNAIKFSPTNDEIVIRGASVALDGKDYIKVGIEDHGPGIPEEDQKHVFEKFYQSEAKKLGFTASTGLGLTFCQMAIKAHNGMIRVDSEKGKGSTFWITLELSETLQQATRSQKPTTIEISEEDQNVLRRYSSQLKALKVHNVSAIMPILDDIDKLELGTDWSSEMRSAVKYANKERYHSLIEMIE